VVRVGVARSVFRVVLLLVAAAALSAAGTLNASLALGVGLGVTPVLAWAGGDGAHLVTTLLRVPLALLLAPPMVPVPLPLPAQSWLWTLALGALVQA
jgi:hypothetical protein